MKTKRILILLALTLLPAFARGQAFVYNTFGRPQAWINTNIDKIHGTLSAADTASIVFYRAGDYKMWEERWYSRTGALVYKIDSTGTVKTGIWNGTAITGPYGGTGQTAYTVGDMLYASSTTALSKLAAVAVGQVLTSAGTGTAPAWSNDITLQGSTPSFGLYGKGSTDTLLFIINDKNAVQDSFVVIMAGGSFGVGGIPKLSTATFGGKNKGFDVLVTREAVAAETDSCWWATIVSGIPVVHWMATDGDDQYITNNTSDALLFVGATGGYNFDNPIDGSIRFTPPAADSSYSGSILTYTAGEVLTYGTAVYLKSDGKVWKADADASTTAPPIGVTYRYVAANGSVTVVHSGYYRRNSWNWTVGGWIYLDTTDGALTQTKPTGNADQVYIIGIAHDADTILIMPFAIVQVVV